MFLWEMCGEINLEGCTLLGSAAEIEKAAVAFDDAKNGGEAKAGSFAGGFGGKERLEDSVEQFRRNSLAGVGNSQENVGAGDGFGMEASGLVFQSDVLGLDAKGAAVRHGVAGVDAEVEKDLVELGRVAHNGVELRVGARLDADGARESFASELFHFGQQRIQIKDRRLTDDTSGEGEDLFNHLGAAFGAGAHGLEHLFRFLAGQLFGKVLSADEDRHEDVVEIVSDTAG